MFGLQELGITNIVFDKSLSRGFDYYTGTIFEIFDTSPKNNRSLIGGGRYDNLTSLFSDKPISGIGFGIGDVTMRDFLETHNLLPDLNKITAPTLTIIPTETELNLEAQKIAQAFRKHNIKTIADISTKKIGKKISEADLRGVTYTLVFGPDELTSQEFTVKNLAESTEISGTLDTLTTQLITNLQ